MGFPEFLVAWAATQTTDLVPLVGARVSPWQSTRKDNVPRITYSQISGDRVRKLAGPTAVARQRFQIDCWGSTPAIARQVARYVTGTDSDQRLDGYLGTIASVKILSCILDDERDNSEPLTDGQDTGTPCISLDFNVAWRAA